MINPITELSGSEFLLFFGVVTVISVALCALYIRARDGSRSLTPGPAPDIVDPYEVAYLRGGENELARVTIVSLAERGYLEVQTISSEGRTERRISQTENRPPSGALSSMEGTVYDWFTEARRVQDIFEGNLPSELAGYCLPLEEKLQQERLVTTDADSKARRTAAWVGGLIIVGGGGLRVLVGLERNEPIGFLVLAVVAGIGGLAIACCARRLSSFGKVYLRQLQDSGAQLILASGTQYALTAAIFGMVGLANTPFSALGEEFKQGEESASRGCGACGGGDGDGGGCGGCGGCG